jgi:hypothetical protein
MPSPSPKENVFSAFSGADTCWKLKHHKENVSGIFSQTFSYLNSALSNSSVFEIPRDFLVKPATYSTKTKTCARIGVPRAETCWVPKNTSKKWLAFLKNE